MSYRIEIANILIVVNGILALSEYAMVSARRKPVSSSGPTRDKLVQQWYSTSQTNCPVSIDYQAKRTA